MVQTLKVVLLGDLGVGKTCLRSQFVHHIFTNAYKATIGGDYLTTTVKIDDNQDPHQKYSALDSETDSDAGLHHRANKVNLQIWDTAGQERFNLISQAFYRGADVVVLVYDITNYESVLSVRDWFGKFLEHCHVERPGVVIVGNKSDKVADRCVDRDEIRDVLCRNGTIPLEKYVTDWDTDLIEVTCKLLASVEVVFQRVAQIGTSLASDNNVTRIVGFDSIDLDQLRTQLTRCAC